MTMKYCSVNAFNNVLANLPREFSAQWGIALTTVALYLIGIVVAKRVVASMGKFDVKGFAFYWNVMLSIFSFAGVFTCAPVLFDAVYRNGLYFATCAPCDWYGGGMSGVFILLFVLSKFAELIDTLLLILSGKPVILLHWFHHATVLLYCWHSYSTRISTGIWFGTMNYFVHSVMYGYFAATQTSFRKKVFPFAVYITLLQLAQMLVGMWITIRAVRFQIQGHECNVNKANSVLGLSMYFSYFVLFFKLFIDHYWLQKKTRGDQKPKRERSALRQVSSKMVQSVVSDTEDEPNEPRRKKIN